MEGLEGVDSRELMVMADPIRGACPWTNLVFSSRYFRELRKRMVRKYSNMICLDNFQGEEELPTFYMAQLSQYEEASLQKCRERAYELFRCT